MKKWADYVVSEVAYDSENLISIATVHQDTDKGVAKGETVNRLKISSDIKNGLSYITIYNGKNSWTKGHKIQTFSIDGNPYLRIDKNKVKLDYLGDLPEPIFEKLQSIIEPEPSRPSSPRGSLPKESSEELPQELDLVPEPEPSPPSNPRGSLPKESAEELPQELDLVPEHHHQKFTQLNYLQQQIDELKNMISDELLPTSKFEEEYNSDKFFKIEELVNDVERSEQNEIEYEIIQTLLNQNKKLDDVEKKLYDLKK
jgi:ribosome-binding factor A